MITKYDIVIVGAGIAGMTAGIYARRAGKSVLVLDGKMHGGQIVQTLNIANWPGLPGISGVDLSEKIYHQMNKLGVDIEYEEVVEIKMGEGCLAGDDDLERCLWVVKTTDIEYLCGAVIIATGTIDSKMGIKREDALTGHGVSYCATCDGAFYTNKQVAVVGGGNTALYDTLYLADIASKVYLVHRRETFRGDKVLVNRVRAKSNVEFVMPYEPIDIIGDKKVAGLKICKVGKDGERAHISDTMRFLEVEGIFVAVGRVPATGFLAEVVDLNDAGYVVAGEDCHTSAPGVFVAGDCRTKSVRQLVTAAADGAVAATEAVHYLR